MFRLGCSRVPPITHSLRCCSSNRVLAQSSEEFQDENVSPEQPDAKAPVRSQAPRPADTASTYSPFSNPLAQRPETRTQAGFMALWAMKRTEAGGNKAEESNSGSSGAISLAPAVEDCASSIKQSLESAASPMAAKAWGTIVESGNTSWLSGSPDQVRSRGCSLPPYVSFSLPLPSSLPSPLCLSLPPTLHPFLPPSLPSLPSPSLPFSSLPLLSFPFLSFPFPPSLSPSLLVFLPLPPSLPMYPPSYLPFSSLLTLPPPPPPPSSPLSVPPLPLSVPPAYPRPTYVAAPLAPLQEEEHQGPQDGVSSRSAAASSLAFSFWPSTTTTTPSSNENKTPGPPPPQLPYYDARTLFPLPLAAAILCALSNDLTVTSVLLPFPSHPFLLSPPLPSLPFLTPCLSPSHSPPPLLPSPSLPFTPPFPVCFPPLRYSHVLQWSSTGRRRGRRS